MTKTYILDSVALAQGWVTALVENQAVLSGGTSATDTATIPKATSNQIAFAFAAPSGEPGVTTWPTGDYHVVIDVSAIGADLSLVGSGAFSAVARVDNTLATATAITNIGWDTSTGTGLHTGTRPSYAFSGTDATDRYASQVAVTNAAAHTSEDITLNLGTSTEYMDGPWASAADRVPYVTPYPQLLAH